VGQLRVVIDSSFDAVPPVGEAVRALCRGEGMSELDAAMVELGIVEYLNNAIEHAFGGRPGGQIDVRMLVDAQRVEADISDGGSPPRGAPLDARTAPAFDPADRSSLPERGFGLSIIRRTFDEVGFGRQGQRNRLTLKKWRRGEE
jgi:serine/threonine-protein kinase RsbW